MEKCKQKIGHAGLLLLVLSVLSACLTCSCSRQAVIVTASPEVIKGSSDCFALLGAPVEEGGPILEKLCSRDIDKILTFARIGEEHGLKIKELICSAGTSPASFKEFFTSLPSQEKARLIKAFEFYGYDINGYGC